MNTATSTKFERSRGGVRTSERVRSRSTLKTAWVLSALIASFLMPFVAQAQVQPWLADRRQRGIGIRVGDLELHPGVSGEVGFDSNYTQASGEVTSARYTINEPIVPSLRLRVTPSLSVSTLGAVRNPQNGAPALPPKFVFGGDLALRLNQLFALGTEFGPGSSTRTYFDGDLSFQADILPKRPWSLGLNGLVSRVAQPTNDPSIPGAALSRTAFGGGADLRWRPGGGTLEWSLGYDGTYMVFDDPQLALDYVDHGPNLKGRWTFFPQTALLYDGRVGFVSYVSPDNQRLIDSTPMSSTLGFNGLITPRIAFLVQGGWKSIFFERPGVDDFDNWVGRAEGTWFIASEQSDAGARGFSSLKLGYQRDVANSGIANYYVVDRLYADLSYGGAGVLFLMARAGVGFVEHPLSSLEVWNGTNFVASSVNEVRPDVLLGGEYRMTANVALLGSLSYTGSLGDHVIQLDSTRDSADNLHFSRFVALVGARWFM